MLTPGTIVHERYRIEHLVGQGAMGAVYAAVDLRLGHTLAELLDAQGEGFPPDTVLAWADQILVALDYLHGRQPPVLHRDLKPQNLKLTPAGQVVLLDFGLARGQLFQTNLAGQRSVIGYRLPYAPLEQIRGEDTDPRSDLFAVAGTLYHLLVGAPPPDALTRAATILAGAPDPLLPSSPHADALPPHLRAVLLACLSLDPARRPTAHPRSVQRWRSPRMRSRSARRRPGLSGRRPRGSSRRALSMPSRFCWSSSRSSPSSRAPSAPSRPVMPYRRKSQASRRLP